MTALETMPASPQPGTLSAYAIGAGAAVLLGGAVLVSGLLPAALHDMVLAGVGGALLVAGLVSFLHGRLSARSERDNDARLAGMRLQALLAMGFVAKLAGLSAGVGVLYAFGLKFESLAAFALAFAAASLVAQLVTAFLMARRLAGHPARPSSSGPTKTPH